MPTTTISSTKTRSPGYTLTIRAEYPNQAGMLGKIATIIGKAGGDVGAVDIVRAAGGKITRDFTITVRDLDHGHAVAAKMEAVPQVRVTGVSDPTFLLHLGGKIATQLKVPVTTRSDLSMVYTPGVGRIVEAIHADPPSVWTLTIKCNTVAVVTDGTAILGLGDLGPEAALPVMEGKAMLFKEFANIDAWPICLNTKDPDRIVEAVKLIAPGFGGINLEDISAPRCFEIETRLKEQLDIPVFHDDQHGTACVVMAALLNACKLTGKRMEDIKVVVNGSGAAGVACIKMMMACGTSHIIACDKTGIIHKGRVENMNPAKEWLADNTNAERIKGTLKDAMTGADFFLGVSGPGVLTPDHLKVMNRDPFVFALANPTPEIMPEEAEPYVRVMATGRSDYPNQINNVLCFPGMFRGALDVRATTINEEMKLAAAHAIADAVPTRDLHEDYIVPSVFNRSVVRAVARAVSETAHKTGVARRTRRSYHTLHI